MDNKRSFIWEDPLEDEIASLDEKGLRRFLSPIDSEPDTTLILNGKRVLAFCSNNYLGLANHPRLKAAAIDAIQTWGVGAGASRFISGNLRLYETLEAEIAALKSCERAIVFHSGYAANVGALSALIGENDLVLFDRLNHASLWDGIRLSKGKLRVYRHKDMDQLRKRLSIRPAHQKAIIVTDGVFSMDGDIAPLPEIVALADQYDALIYLDDAHATGVLGEKGAGTGAHFRLRSDRIIQMGTLSKALGGFGGFVAGSDPLIQYLINKARPLIYTTALPPSVLAAAIAAVRFIQEETDLKAALWANTDRFCQKARKIGFDPCGSETPIVPILIGDAKRAMAFSRRLFDEGIYVPAVRPPTVPSGQSRLRITLMATHSEAQIDYLARSLQKIGSELNVL